VVFHGMRYTCTDTWGILRRGICHQLLLLYCTTRICGKEGVDGDTTCFGVGNIAIM
jgi:hypothetical protein